ncbi:hypothetical protein K491DRAFT_763880 [Lophiostoma macrostomum CBS 122681]|uniref:F-box domain-containing protein n=1 Tax=Lophiostoma macrostomum CBS 122681 TaxID=1314788 RepID=A0A6A6SKB6_9PLEO|nr:hypothetical protein K491DRAFT_763880 [Lophiostoma macrostomum CBS 122681]
MAQVQLALHLKNVRPKVPGLLSLPDELLLEIALLVGATSDRAIQPPTLCSLALACKQVRHVSQESLVRTAVVQLHKVYHYNRILFQNPAMAQKITSVTIISWGTPKKMKDALLPWYTPEKLCKKFNTETQYGFGPVDWVNIYRSAGAHCIVHEIEQITVLLLCLPNLQHLAFETSRLFERIFGITGISELVTSSPLRSDHRLTPPYRILEKLLYDRIHSVDFGPASHRDGACIDTSIEVSLFTTLRYVALSGRTMCEYCPPQLYRLAYLPPSVQHLQINQCQSLSHKFLRELQATDKYPALEVVRFAFELPASIWLARLIESEDQSHRTNFGDSALFQRNCQALKNRKVAVETYFPSATLLLKEHPPRSYVSPSLHHLLHPHILPLVRVRYEKVNLIAALGELREILIPFKVCSGLKHFHEMNLKSINKVLERHIEYGSPIYLQQMCPGEDRVVEQ